MATYPSILKYSPFSSLVEPSFWHKLAQLKLDVDRLDETERKIWGMYHMTPVPNRVSRFILDCTAFNSDFNQPLNTMGAYGALLNKNTIESFKSTDKMALLKEHGMKMVESIKSGEALMNPALLTRFLLLTFSDLKKYRFYHWFAFPAFSVPNANINIVSPPRKLTDVFTKHQLQALYEKYFTIPEWTQKVAFICEVNELTTKCYSLTEVKTLFSKSNAKVNELYLVISDPSTLPQNPGWTPRNILHMLAYHCPDICQQHIRVICLRLSCQIQDASSDQSLLFEVVLPYVNLNDDEFVESLQWVGWERHPNGKMVPRTTDLSEEMDPSRLAESSVDLNLKLMKWRLAPKLDLDIIKKTSCLLLGSGTLGCAVARTLLGWGVRTITLVDNGRVSYSNPVRQSLFTHTDCINGGRPKAEAAADALRAIFPGVKARGVQLTIPMPGHVVGESMYAEAARRVEILEKLVEDHDVVFLLMDSRESRWLPTLLAAIHKKITICSALGFDTYLVMRHGVLPKMDSDVDNDSAGTTSEKSSNLGCYFCNDVTAPGNSQVDRTLDQQCTVTRPGLSFVAAGLAVELMVSLLQHPLKAQAPPACESDAESGPLSIVPHSLRGFLSQFTQILPASPRFGNCIACSEQVLNEYSKHGFKFLYTRAVIRSREVYICLVFVIMALGSQVESAAENGINGMEKHASRSGKSDDSSCSFGKKGGNRSQKSGKMKVVDKSEDETALLTKNESKVVVNGHVDDEIPSGSVNGVSISETSEKSSNSKNEMSNGTGEPEENVVEKGEVEATKEKEKDDKKEEQEVVFIQDMGFMVKIVSPGAEPFDIQVSSMELVQEIHQLLMDREDTCHRTCFSLQLDGNTLDNFAELKNIEGLKEGSVIKVVEEPYTMREARIHVRHVRDLLKSLDPADAYNGVDCSSLSFLNVVTQGDILEKKKMRPESVDCTPPDYIMPNSRDRPLLPLQPQAKEQKGPQCLKVLTTSGWNPPPGYRKMHGDLMYLYVVTLEEKHYHITACSRGFFVNQSSEEDFNPKPSTPSHLCHSLIELLNQISPAFKRNFSVLQKKRTQRHPFERVATPYQVYAWSTPQLEHTIDAIRAEDTFSSKLGYEEHIPGQTRDWNEELQTTRELPRKNLPERLLRERAIFKVHSDFVAAATRGAMAVIDGNVMAINPGEEAKMQMFIWNNIFFSLGFDVRDHYKELGGDAAAFVAPRNDLQGVRVYSAVDLQGLYTLGTVVIDYRGYRVTAQSIIPGILEREQEQSVVYGSIDFGKTVISHPKYLEMLNKAGQQLKILPHKVMNDKGEEVELCSSVECKGIIGNDGRHYILDLLRTFPPDVNFLKLEGEELSKEVRALGFPIEHKHKLCCLRQELIDSFVESKYMMFIKYAAFHLQQLGVKKQREREALRSSQERETTPVEKDVKDKERDHVSKKESSIENENKVSTPSETGAENQMEADEAKKIVESITDSITSGEKQELEESTKEIVKKAALAVGSLKDTEFDVRFNPDVYSPGVQHVDPTGDQLRKERQLVKDASAFLLTVQIPTFIRDCLDHSAAPLDGFALSEAMHNRGINIRYLGKIVHMLSTVKQLEYLHSIAIAELITRSAKHVFTSYMQTTELMSLSVAVSHFLNCFLSACQVPHPQQVADELLSKTSKRRNKRNKGRVNPLLNSDSTEWANLTPKSLWSQLKADIRNYFDWELAADSIESAVENFGLQKISLLRSFCIKTGVQILLREYTFDNKNRLTFFEEDIINIFPVVKHINPRATDAYNFYTTGQTKIQQGYLKDGYELISEALNLLNNVYGAMHPEIAQCLRMLARLNYIMGEHSEAMVYQQKAVLMSERVNGIDHPYTITEYTHLALYCFANSQVSTALKLLYRARYLALMVCGENHPEIALLDSNISLILHAVGEYELSLRFLEKALALNIRYYGPKSLKVAVSYHLVARTQSCMGDFRSALNNEKETYAIYKQQLGEAHEKTRESSECLRHLTSQAVVLQKKMNEIYTGKPGASLPPIQIQPPSMGSVLDMLNVINGILFVQISPQDIENFKAEIEKRQLKETSPLPVEDKTDGALEVEGDKKSVKSS